MKVVLGAEGLHDQACVFIAGSRLLRITITETRSTEDAQRLYKKAVSGQSAVNAADAKPLAGIHDEAVLAGNTVEMRRQNLVVDFSLRDFVADDESGLALARALAAKVWFTSKRVARMAGARPNRTPVPSETSAVNRKTR